VKPVAAPYGHPRKKEAKGLKKGRWMCKKEQKYTATGLPM
jgi:hypothetical protein